MSAPFEPGDVVVCIRLDSQDEYGFMKVGGIYRVTIVEVGDLSGVEEWGIDVQGDPEEDSDTLWPAVNFRKIDEEVTPAFREQMRSLGKQEPVA